MRHFSIEMNYNGTFDTVGIIWLKISAANGVPRSLGGKVTEHGLNKYLQSNNIKTCDTSGLSYFGKHHVKALD